MSNDENDDRDDACGCDRCGMLSSVVYDIPEGHGGGRMSTQYRVEIYNHWPKGSKNPTNGWLVARVVGGCRHETVSLHGTNEIEARACRAAHQASEDRDR